MENWGDRGTGVWRMARPLGQGLLPIMPAWPLPRPLLPLPCSLEPSLPFSSGIATAWAPKTCRPWGLEVGLGLLVVGLEGALGGQAKSDALENPEKDPGRKALMSRRLRAYARRYSWAGMVGVGGQLRCPSSGGRSQGSWASSAQACFSCPDLPSLYIAGRPRGTMWSSLESSFPAILRDFGAVSWDFSGADSSASGAGPHPWPLGATSSCYTKQAAANPATAPVPRDFSGHWGLRSFMSANTFGNAGFSSSCLAPGLMTLWAH